MENSIELLRNQQYFVALYVENKKKKIIMKTRCDKNENVKMDEWF